MCGFVGELYEGIEARMINDLEKFTKIFVEERLGIYFKDDEGELEQIDSGAKEGSSETAAASEEQVLKLKG